jgi:UDP-N-acetylmuramate dehydrogenase
MNRKQALFKNYLPPHKSAFLKGRFTPNALIKSYTTIRIGGAAVGLYIPEGMEDLQRFYSLCKKFRISLLPIGGGSNIIVTDKGLNNIFLKLSSPCFKKISIAGNSIYCGAGVTLNKLCSFAEMHSLSGVEFLTGIPATVGGAVFRNAGAHSKDISCILKEIEYLDCLGNKIKLNRKEIDFRYRQSGLKNIIILSACFRLKKSQKSLIRGNVNKYLRFRLSSQDYTAPSAGCVFKNPDNAGMGAGEMLDRCGLKGKRIGNAQISKKHANFILNKGDASADDILRLICFARKKVQSVYGVTLETEVEIF